jgi:polyketide synthase 12/myxalamid-type polyketide synthase MxaB
VLCASADVCRAADLAGVLDRIDATMPPLAGVVHAAGVLNDGVLAYIDWPRFAEVLAPKLLGAWNLHALTRGRRLDFFVLFASVAAVIGAGGQGGYGAANAALDALAHHRRALGLPALAVDWGAWAGAGMAAAAARDRVDALGLGWISPEAGRAALLRLLCERAPQRIVAPIDWAGLAAAIPADRRPRLLERVAPRRREAEEDGAPGHLLRELAAASPRARIERLEGYLRERIAGALGPGMARAIPSTAPFHTLGLDSLAAVELRNALVKALGRSVPTTIAFDYPTIGALAEFLAGEVAGPGPGAPPAPGSRDPQAVEHVRALSDAEAEALLAAELSELEPGPR